MHFTFSLVYSKTMLWHNIAQPSPIQNCAAWPASHTPPSVALHAKHPIWLVSGWQPSKGTKGWENKRCPKSAAETVLKANRCLCFFRFCINEKLTWKKTTWYVSCIPSSKQFALISASKTAQRAPGEATGLADHCFLHCWKFQTRIYVRGTTGNPENILPAFTINLSQP